MKRNNGDRDVIHFYKAESLLGSSRPKLLATLRNSNTKKINVSSYIQAMACLCLGPGLGVGVILGISSLSFGEFLQCH